MTTTSVSSNGSITRPQPSVPVASLSGQLSAITTAAGVAETSSRDVQSAALERMNLQKKSEREEQASKKAAVEENSENIQKPVRRMSEIQFAYNFRGDLRIRFMDSINKLVYQTPPTLFARMTDTMAYSKSSVDMTV